MARELAALRVTIGLRADGQADHPDFNTLPIVIASGMDWSYFVDQFGDGWKYDNVAGHIDDDPTNDSPVGVQLGVLLVPEQFALEAVAAFPTLCEQLTEAQCQAFYETRHQHGRPDIDNAPEVLEGLRSERELRVARGQDTTDLDAKIDRALDPDDPEPGVTRNRRRRWASYKTQAGVEFKEPSSR